MIPKDHLVYKSYIDGKMTKRTRAKEYLQLVHTNMYGTFSVHAWEGYGYLFGIYTKSLRLDQGDMFSKFVFFH